MKRKVVTALIALVLVFTLIVPAFADAGDAESDVQDFALLCEMGKINPAMAKLDAAFKLEAGTVQALFCKGYDLGTIRQALRSALKNGTTVEQELGIETEVIDIDDPVCDPETEICEPVCDPETEICEPVCDPETENCEPVCNPETGENCDLDDEIEGWKESIYCTTDKVHPTGKRYSEIYGVSYKTIMDWFCDGFGFGNIKHALNTAASTEGKSAGDLLKEKKDDSGWGEIWQAYGKPGKMHPVFGANWKKSNLSQEEGDPVVKSPKAKGKPSKPGK